MRRLSINIFALVIRLLVGVLVKMAMMKRLPLAVTNANLDILMLIQEILWIVNLVRII